MTRVDWSCDCPQPNPDRGYCSNCDGTLPLRDTQGTPRDTQGTTTSLTEDVSQAVSRAVPWGNTERMLEVLGIRAPVGTSFPCVIPTHTECSARLRQGGNHLVYECPGVWPTKDDGTPKGHPGLAGVRASIGFGEPRLPGKFEACRWRERLRHEAGVLDPRPVRVLRPDDVSMEAHSVAAGIALLLGLRDLEKCPVAPDEFTFSRRFAMAYCSLTEEQARRGIEELRHPDIQAIEWTGEKVGSAYVWRLGKGVA